MFVVTSLWDMMVDKWCNHDCTLRAAIKENPDMNSVGLINNCAARSNGILNAAGIRTNGIAFPEGFSRDIQSILGSSTYFIPQGGAIPAGLLTGFP